ncbi:MAG: FAD binding domain-containing protein [Anaerolineae bacterium]|nr:FAD binding domain-containing protein [Anaerolineae bacterium]
MLPKLQSFYKPETIEQARELLARPDLRTLPLYGGPELFDDLAEAAEIEAVVSLSELGLNTLTETPEGLRIGAMVALAALPESQFLRVARQDLAARPAGVWAVEALLTAAERAYSLNLRAMWTVGAVVAHGGPASPLLTTLVALDARVELAGDITVPLAHYLFRRARTDLITAVVVPLAGGFGPVAYEAVARTPADEPIVCAAARARLGGGAPRQVQAVAVALGGVDKAPAAAGEVEQALLAGPATAEAVEAAVAKLDALEPPGDFRGSGEYRREMAKVLARRVLRQALGLDE